MTFLKNTKSYFFKGCSPEELKKYTTISTGNTDDRLTKIEEKVNSINISLKSKNSVPSIARNALINHIIMYILLIIIIIFNISALAKKACSKINDETLSAKKIKKIF
jgi:t-SNARE complex subunit (syntaxin)